MEVFTGKVILRISRGVSLTAAPSALRPVNSPIGPSARRKVPDLVKVAPHKAAQQHGMT